MACYRVGNVVRLMRQACHMTQEELAFGICSVETLSRIENGRHGVKKETYRALMEKMGRNHEYEYAICTGKDMELLEEKKLIEDAMAKFDYDRVQRYLQILKRKIANNIWNNQYVKRLESIIMYRKGVIEAEELIKRLEETIRMTVPDYEKYVKFGIRFPFSMQEILILVSLANAMKGEKSIYLLQYLLDNLEQEYMDSDTSTRLKIMILRNMSKRLGELKRYETSIEISNKALVLSVEKDCGYIISTILVDVAWCFEQMAEDKQRQEKEIKRKLRQAYYIAAARNEKKVMKIICNYYQEVFQEEVK